MQMVGLISIARGARIAVVRLEGWWAHGFPLSTVGEVAEFALLIYTTPPATLGPVLVLHSLPLIPSAESDNANTFK